MPGQTFTWIGANNGDWNLGTNWDLGTAPATGADVVINNGSNVIYNTSVEINTLTVAANSRLTERQWHMTIEHSASTLAGDFTFNFGTLTGAGDVTSTAS